MRELLERKVKFSKLVGEPPWDLLLLADPSRNKVESYLSQGDCYVALIDSSVVGVFVLLEIEARVVELMNIAVSPIYQGKGLGKLLLHETIAVARRNGFRHLEVGTGNSSLDQLAFYQKGGFRICGVDRDFFVRNYDQQIVENGIQCLDMIRLAMDL